MALIKTDALVIKSSDYSESTRLVTLFSRDCGRIRVLAKGIKRLKSHNRGALESFSLVQVTLALKDPSALGTLRESTLIRSPTALRSDYDRWLLGSLVLEVADRATVAAHEAAGLFERLCSWLEELDTTERPEDRTLEVLIETLAWFGFAPQFGPCCLCGGGEPFTGFRIDQCGVTCGKCAGGHPDFRPLPPGSIKVLERLAALNPEARHTLRISSKQREQLFALVIALLEYHLEIRLTTARMLPSLRDAKELEVRG